MRNPGSTSTCARDFASSRPKTHVPPVDDPREGRATQPILGTEEVEPPRTVLARTTRLIEDPLLGVEPLVKRDQVTQYKSSSSLFRPLATQASRGYGGGAHPPSGCSATRRNIWRRRPAETESVKHSPSTALRPFTVAVPGRAMATLPRKWRRLQLRSRRDLGHDFTRLLIDQSDCDS